MMKKIICTVLSSAAPHDVERDLLNDRHKGETAFKKIMKECLIKKDSSFSQFYNQNEITYIQYKSKKKHTGSKS